MKLCNSSSIKAAIVCGYGNIIDDNLLQYINSVVNHIKQYQIHTLILSGGCSFTQSTVSEAELMQQLIREKLPDINIILETQALTTLHNCLYSKEKLNDIDVEHIYIFCDRIRWLKTFLLSKMIFKTYFYKIIPIGRKENILIYLMQFPSMIVQILAVIFPIFEKLVFQSKKTWIQKTRS
jgi:DUF218 domain